MSKHDTMRGLLAVLQERGLTDYGSDIPSELVHEALGIEMPATASKAEFDRLAMIELAAIDYCRNVLIGQGKYLMGTRSGYRVLLPSENKAQVDSYMGSADRKLARALKLSRNTPSDAQKEPDQVQARILLKQSGMRPSFKTPSYGFSFNVPHTPSPAETPPGSSSLLDDNAGLVDQDVDEQATAPPCITMAAPNRAHACA